MTATAPSARPFRCPFPRLLRLACALLLMVSTSDLLAQEDAAALEFHRQQERERQLRQQQEPRPDVRLQDVSPSSARLPRDEHPCFPIRRIVVTGVEAERFQWLADHTGRAEDGHPDPAIGACLGTGGVNLVMRRLQNALIERGYITTRILAAPQDLSTGTLHLTVVPGRIHAVRFLPDASGQMPSRATHWNALPAAADDLLNLRDIEQALENFKRLPSVEADLQIAPSEDAAATPGDSDLLITWQQTFPFRLTLSADDSGTQASGRHQGAATVAFDNWWTLNDLFYITHSQSLFTDGTVRGTRGYTVHYSLPLGYSLLALTTSHNTYHQTVAGLNGAVRYDGVNDTGDLRLSHILHRTAAGKTHVFLRGWQRASSNFTDDEEVLVQRRRMGGWEAGAGHRAFIGQATLEGTVAYRRGTGAFDALPAPEEARGAMAEGTARPRLWTADLQFNQPFRVGGEAFRYGTSLRAQWNGTPLVPQDRFAIGGRYTVRGFDGELVLAAERGWFVRNDLGWQIGGQELYLGLDHGAVAGRSAAQLLGRTLTGAVIGLRGGGSALSYDLFTGTPVARPEGFQAARTVAGFSITWTL